MLIGFVSCVPASQAPQTSGDATVRGVQLLANPAGTARVLLTLENHSSEQVGYNLCSSTLERLRDGEWIAVPSDEVCTMELRLLGPTRSVAYEKNFSPDLPSGDYRYVTSVESPAGTPQRVVASAPFRVL